MEGRDRERIPGTSWLVSWLTRLSWLRLVKSVTSELKWETSFFTVSGRNWSRKIPNVKVKTEWNQKTMGQYPWWTYNQKCSIKCLWPYIGTHQKAESHSLPNKSLTPDMRSPLWAVGQDCARDPQHIKGDCHCPWWKLSPIVEDTMCFGHKAQRILLWI